MQDGSAGTTGEEMEQLFSYLSRLNLTTKNMTAAGACCKSNIFQYHVEKQTTCVL